MKRLKISAVEAGMIIAEDVFGRSGEVVLPVGAQLTEKSIDLLENWGISSVAVEGEEEDVTQKFSAEQLGEIEKEIQDRFVANAKENPFVAHVMQLCVRRKLKQKLSPAPTPPPAPATPPASTTPAAPTDPTPTQPEAPKTS